MWSLKKFLRKRRHRKIQKKFISYLRSTKYSQNNIILHGNYSFCLIGLLCNFYIETYNKEKWFWKRIDKTSFGLFYSNKVYVKAIPTTEMFKELEQWSGIDFNNKLYSTPREIPYNAITLNDQYSFNEIADILENEYIN